MASSPSHAFGQIIGNLIEVALHDDLQAVAKEFNLYLDKKRPRAARGGKSKVSWVDGRGNSHDLDYVLEQGGTEQVIGRPRAFIEIAWRRYTKHSKNKAQEIEGAVGHLRQRYYDSSPFLGAVLAGEFTAPSLAQLKSHGFTILYFPYQSVVEAFAAVGINAAFGEGTPDDEVAAKVEKYKALSIKKKHKLVEVLRSAHGSELEDFVSSLRVVLSRQVEFVHILPLHGSGIELTSIDEAISYIENYDEALPCERFAKYELIVRYSNKIKIDGEFPTKADAIEFLQRMI